MHMYSLNLEATVLGILERVGFIEINRVSRSLPWKHIPMGTRRQVSASGGVVVCVCVFLLESGVKCLSDIGASIPEG